MWRWTKALARFGIQTVLDVGANDGGYGRMLRTCGYKGRIISFEPLSGPYSRLYNLASRDGNWTCSRLALGAREATAIINVSRNSYSSSLLPMTAEPASLAAGAGYVAQEEVRVARLDDVLETLVSDDEALFLKVDTQGFESQVLDGASGALPRLTGVQLEMSLKELYEGQQLFASLFARLTSAGYECWGIDPEFGDRETGRMLQVNGTFFRS